MVTDIRKERAKRSNDAKDWTIELCLEDLYTRINIGNGEDPNGLRECDCVVMVFSKRFPDGSSREIIVQAGTYSGNEAIGILHCGIANMMEPL